MQAKALFFSAILISLASLSFAVHPECAVKLLDIQETLLDLYYSTQDQDLGGVALSYKSISKGADTISLACAEEPSKLRDEEETGWIQGCQESFGFLRDITHQADDSLEATLLAVRELERFYPMFQGACRYADDDLLDENSGFDDFDSEKKKTINE